MTDAIAGAIIGVIGTILVTAISLAMYWFIAENKRKRKAVYSAIIIIHTLEEYIGKCIEVCMDDGGLEEMGGLVGEKGLSPEAEEPSPPKYPKDVDWQSLQDNTIVYKALSFVVKTRKANMAIMSTLKYGAHPEDIYDTRQYEYAQLGILACSIVDDLCKTYKIENTESVSNSRNKFFLEIICKPNKENRI